MKRIIPVILFLAILLSGTPALSAEGVQTLAVLPFEIHSAGDLAHVRRGMVYMLHSRLSWPDKVVVVPKLQVETLLSGLKSPTPASQLKAVAQTIKSDYILAGSITQLAGAFSIDAKIYDTANKRYMAFFEQSKNSDDLIDKVDRIAASINQKIFNRSTVTWEQMEQERQARINEFKRKNPEYLMKNPYWQQQADQDPGWKIWKYLF